MTDNNSFTYKEDVGFVRFSLDQVILVNTRHSNKYTLLLFRKIVACLVKEIKQLSFYLPNFS